MGKVFLSHSSKNKDYVRPIFEFFGKDKCVYDEMTFEFGMKTIEEIFSGIDSSDIFVFFISNDSLESEWVKNEITYAKEKLDSSKSKLSQIFPIIIDKTINYSDERIPEFLRTGTDCYNIRYIQNSCLACKKIEAQLIKLKMNVDRRFVEQTNFFYGRDFEKSKFGEEYDSYDDDGKRKTIKCMVLSGIEGIGRKSFARNALQSKGLMESYYFPMRIQVEKNDDIVDLIMKIEELGVGNFALSQIKDASMEDKIELLAELVKELQKYNEFVFINDNYCLVNTGGLVYWFEKILEKIDPSIVFVIATPIRIDTFRYRRNRNLFCLSIAELNPSDTLGMLRHYSKVKNCPFEDDDIGFFKHILNGYPPQIKACVELACDNGIQHVKDHSYIIANYSMDSFSNLLNQVINKENEMKCKGLLALLSKMGTTPITFLNQLFEINPIYKEILGNFKLHMICDYTGLSGEYVRLNRVIADVIQRSHYDISDDINNLLLERTNEFKSNMENPEYTDYLQFSEFVYYLKESLKDGIDVSSKLLYSSIYVKTIIELYNSRKFSKVIDIVRKLRELDYFGQFDEETEKLVYFYFCESLARLKDTAFEEEISYFRGKNDCYEYYNFLQGFYLRMKGKFKDAEHYYQNVLVRNPNHDTSKREIVSIYTHLQQYDKALEYARENYVHRPENLFHIQAYLECLVHCGKYEKEEIEKMMSIARSVNAINPSGLYYQIEAQYAFYINGNYQSAIEVIDEGLKAEPKSFYVLKTKFDICKDQRDIPLMEQVLKELRKTEVEFKSAVDIREALLDAFLGKSKIGISVKVQGISNVSDDTKNLIMREIDSIKSTTRRL